MHELAITRSVVDAVAAHVPGGSTVTCVHLEIGALSGVLPDSVRFCFDLVTRGTNLAGARLEISRPPARCTCRECGSEFGADEPVPRCRCGSADVAILSGEELRITSVEVS